MPKATVGASVTLEMAQRLENEAREKCCPISFIIEQALQRYFEEQENGDNRNRKREE